MAEKWKKSLLVAVAAFLVGAAFAESGVWIKREGVGTGGTDWTSWSAAENWEGGTVATGSDGFADLTAASGQYVALPDGTFSLNRLVGAGDTVVRGSGTLALGSLEGDYASCWLYTDYTVVNSSVYRGPSGIVNCGTLTAKSGSDLLWTKPTFRLDLFADASGGTRTAGPVPSNYSMKWNSGAMTFTAPHGSPTNIVANWSQTAGSPFLARAAGQEVHVLSVGTLVAGAGIPDDTFLKRVFPDGTIELSAAATETRAENALTFSAFTADVSIAVETLWPYNGSSKRTLRLQKYREADELVLRTRFWGEGTDNRYLTITTENGMYPGKLVLWGAPGAATYLTLDDARVELAATLPAMQFDVPTSSRHAVLSVPAGASYACGCLSSVKSTLVKAGAGQLTAPVVEGALAETKAPVVIREGAFAPVKYGDYGELFIASVTVKAGAALVVPKTGLHVGSLILEAGATLDGEGLLEYDTADESIFGDISILCAGLRPYGAEPTGALDVSVASGAFHSWAEDGDTVLIFDSGSATLKVDGRGTLDLLCVGGGGGGGAYGGGGGGGGGVIHTQVLEVVAGYYGLHVGAGGAGAPKNNAAGENGGNSGVFGIVALGGGGGGSLANVCNGGCGGGAGAYYYLNANERNGGAGTEGQGFAGGKSVTSNWYHGYAFGGGGGGAGTNGEDAVSEKRAGDGGEGVRCSIWSADRIYGSGGGGGAADGAAGAAGTGGTGAGNGGAHSGGVAQPGTDGTDGWGGGGGGGGRYVESGQGAGGKGGGGIVIVRFRKEISADVHERGAATGGMVRHRKGFASHTFTQDGTFTLTEPAFVDVLTVGGGGGGGACTGGGGGGGGVTVVSNLLLAAGSYPVEVGQGGEGATSSLAQGLVGGRSRLVTDADDAYCPQAFGGGGGGSREHGGGDGASGGGAGAPYYPSGHPAFFLGGAAVYGAQGFGGGTSTNGYAWSIVQGAGGGGAGGTGGSALDLLTPGVGGIGRSCDFSGQPKYYGGGGGGGSPNEGVAPEYYLAAGGLGGGGRGGGKNGYPNPYPGEDGEDGLGGGGGGGGGAGDASAAGGRGGCGCVVIRYRVKPVGMMLIFR